MVLAAAAASRGAGVRCVAQPHAVLLRTAACVDAHVLECPRVGGCKVHGGHRGGYEQQEQQAALGPRRRAAPA